MDEGREEFVQNYFPHFASPSTDEWTGEVFACTEEKKTFANDSPALIESRRNEIKKIRFLFGFLFF